MWGDKLTAAAWSGCDLHATESLRLPSPVLFLTLHACLFSVQIKNRSFVLVEERCFFSLFSLTHMRWHTHNTQTTRTQRQYWRAMLMAIHYWKGNRLNMTGVCYGRLCSRHLYCRASLSVSTLRSFSSRSVCVYLRESSPISVVFVSAALLITICLIFPLDTKVSYRSAQCSFAVGFLLEGSLEQRCWFSEATSGVFKFLGFFCAV